MANFRLIFEWVFKRQRPTAALPLKSSIEVHTSHGPSIHSKSVSCAAIKQATLDVRTYNV